LDGNLKEDILTGLVSCSMKKQVNASSTKNAASIVPTKLMTVDF
jgi:hypothetical protein